MSDTLTLTQGEIEDLAGQLMYPRSDLLFQNKANRDAVHRHCKEINIDTVRQVVKNQQLDPRYTVEGRMIADRGLGNDYRHFFSSLYELANADRGW